MGKQIDTTKDVICATCKHSNLKLNEDTNQEEYCCELLHNFVNKDGYCFYYTIGECNYCSSDYEQAFYCAHIRYHNNSKETVKQIPVNYCPVCGRKL